MSTRALIRVPKFRMLLSLKGTVVFQKFWFLMSLTPLTGGVPPKLLAWLAPRSCLALETSGERFPSRLYTLTINLQDRGRARSTFLSGRLTWDNDSHF